MEIVFHAAHAGNKENNTCKKHRAQLVRAGDVPPGAVLVGFGAPQETVLDPLPFTILTTELGVVPSAESPPMTPRSRRSYHEFEVRV